jgi:hypothetical protein
VTVTGSKSSIGVIVNTYWDVQGARIALTNRLRTVEDREGYLSAMADRLTIMENDLSKQMRYEVENHPLWHFWLKKIKGMGEVLSAQLIHLITGQVHTEECRKKRAEYFSKKSPRERRKYLQYLKQQGEYPKDLPPEYYQCDCPWMEIERFPTVSSLWKYAGLGSIVEGKAVKREKGKKCDWNPKLKALCWKIAESFVKQRGSPYRELYEKFKEEEKRKNPELTGRHIEARARRKTVKLFLAHLYEKWHELKRLEAGLPYPQARLHHKNYIPPPAI